MKQGSILAYLKPHTPALSQNNEKTELESTIPIVADKAKPNHAIDVQAEASQEIAAVTINEISSPEFGWQAKLSNSRAAITKVRSTHIERLKSITSTLLPVRYSDRFFTECLEQDKDDVIAFVCLFDSQPVGWIRCRLEPCPAKENSTYQQIYIQALGVLAPYRDMGLASALLDAVESSQKDVTSIYAHVWEKNEDALAWYAKRQFRQILLVPHYYRKLRPSSAWIVRKDLT